MSSCRQPCSPYRANRGPLAAGGYGKAGAPGIPTRPAASLQASLTVWPSPTAISVAPVFAAVTANVPSLRDSPASVQPRNENADEYDVSSELRFATLVRSFGMGLPDA